MPVPTFTKMGPYPEFQDVVNKLNQMVGELQNLMVSLDTLNILKLNAKVIEANTITADKMNVSELSAISANLGHITAGLIEAIEMYGSYIATAVAGVYPRVEFSSSNKLIRAETTSTQYMQIEALGGSGSAAITLVDNLLRAFFQASAGQLFIGTVFGSGSTTIGSGNHLFLSAAAGHLVQFDSWSEVYSIGDSQTLAAALNNLSSAISAHTSTLSNHESRISALESP